MNYLTTTFVLLSPSLISAVQKGCVQCPCEDGVHLHPTRQDAFVRCSAGVAVFEECPKDSVYRTDLKLCDRQSMENTEHDYSGRTSSSGVCSQGCSVYERFTQQGEVHSVCRTENGETCKNDILGRGLSVQYGNEVAHAHNVKRNLVAGGSASSALSGPLPPASNMMKMVFHGELAKVAQAWTDACLLGHDCYNCRKITSNTSAIIGQNGYYLFSHDVSPPNPEDLVKAWWDEIEKMTSNDTIHRFSIYDRDVGHFTQVAWANTFQVGCGWTLEGPYKEGSWNTHYVSCNYNAGGNIVGESVYEEGPPATECRHGREGRRYNNLCSPAPSPDPCGEENRNSRLKISRP